MMRQHNPELSNTTQKIFLKNKLFACIIDQGARCLSAFRLVGTAILVVCFVLHFVFVVSELRCVLLVHYQRIVRSTTLWTVVFPSYVVRTGAYRY